MKITSALIGAALLLAGSKVGPVAAQTVWSPADSGTVFSACVTQESSGVCGCMQPLVEAAWTPQQFVNSFGHGKDAISNADMLVFAAILSDCGVGVTVHTVVN